MSNKKSSQKQVTVTAVYKFRHVDRICFTVKSSDGSTTYTTCFSEGRASCTCPATRECYHIKQLASRAFDWRVSAGHVRVPAEQAEQVTTEQAEVVSKVKQEVARAIESHKHNESQAEAGRQLLRQANTEQRERTARVVGKLVGSGVTPGALMPPPSAPTFGQMSAPTPRNIAIAAFMR